MDLSTIALIFPYPQQSLIHQESLILVGATVIPPMLARKLVGGNPRVRDDLAQECAPFGSQFGYGRGYRVLGIARRE
jgi:hypothetical protein